MPGVYFAATYGGIPLLIGSISTDRGRDVVVQSPANGDIHTLTDQGKRVRRCTAEILFCEQPGLAPPTDRYDRFVSLFEDGDPHILSHPLDGQYTARGENLSVDGDASSLTIRVSATFLREQTRPAVIPADAGADPSAGVASVTAGADRAIGVLDEFELESSVPAAIKAEVTAWDEAEDLDAQAVFLSVGSLTQQIDEDIDELGLTADLELFPAYQAMILLRYELVKAAGAFTSSAETVFDLFVAVPRPVLAICAEIYGARQARDRAEQVTKMNRIRTPGRVPAGTTLKMPSAGAA
jgi:hypothetical protein